MLLTKISRDNIEDWKLDWNGTLKKIITSTGLDADENVEAAEMGRGNRPVFFELFKITFCSSCSFYGSVGLINARGKKSRRDGIFNFSRGERRLDCAEYSGSSGTRQGAKKRVDFCINLVNDRASILRQLVTSTRRRDDLLVAISSTSRERTRATCDFYDSNFVLRVVCVGSNGKRIFKEISIITQKISVLSDREAFKTPLATIFPMSA